MTSGKAPLPLDPIRLRYFTALLGREPTQEDYNRLVHCQLDIPPDAWQKILNPVRELMEDEAAAFAAQYNSPEGAEIRRKFRDGEYGRDD